MLETKRNNNENISTAGYGVVYGRELYEEERGSVDRPVSNRWYLVVSGAGTIRRALRSNCSSVAGARPSGVSSL